MLPDGMCAVELFSILEMKELERMEEGRKARILLCTIDTAPATALSITNDVDDLPRRQDYHGV